MKRLLIGGLAVGSMLFAASGVAAANTATPLAAPTAPSLSKLVTTSSVSGGAWPLATNPGTLTVSFATPDPAMKISGYIVTCKAPKTDTLKVPLATPLPNLVATFAVDANTGASSDSDADYSNAAGVTSLVVGPYSYVEGTTLPPLSCSIVAVNAGGASRAGKASTATSPAPSGTCSVDTATAGAGDGLLTKLGGGDLSPLLGDNNDPPTGPTLPVTVTGKQTASNFDIVLADLSGFGGSSTTPFCTTNEQYQPHLLADQPVSFSPTLKAIPAVLTGTKAHPAQVSFSNLGLTATVHSGLSLTVTGSVSTFVYDAYDFHTDACVGKSGVTCITDPSQVGAPNWTAIVGSEPPSGASFIVVMDSNSHVVLPGKPIVGPPVTLTLSKTGNPNPTPPAAATLTFGGAQTTLSIATLGSPVVLNVTVAPPGQVLLGMTGGASDGGDLNYTSAIAAAPWGLF